MPLRGLFNIHLSLFLIKFLVIVALFFSVWKWWQLTLLICISYLLFYYNSYFKWDYLHLLWPCKQSAGVKTTAPAALSLDPDLKKGCLRKSPDIQPVVGAASAENNDPFASAPQENIQISAPSTSTPTVPRAEATTQIRRACTSLAPQLCSHTVVGVQYAASAASDTSPHPILPSVPNSPFTLGLGLPAFPFEHPYSAGSLG